jgi:hypothetical protein
MEYTQGFSPHPRTALGPPLPMGVAGLKEPAEFWFTEWNEDSLAAWRAAMPAGFEILSAKPVEGTSLAKLCSEASYIIEPLNGSSPDEIREVLRNELTELGALLSVNAEGNEVRLSVTDLERSGASRMVKALIASGTISGWKDLSIVRAAVGRQDGDAGTTSFTEE